MDLIATFLVICIALLYSGNVLVCGEPNVYNVLQFGANGEGKIDDSQAFLKAWEALCGDSGVEGTPTLLVPLGTFLLVPSQFQGPCKSKNVHIQVVGNIVAPNNSEWGKSCTVKTWITFLNIEGLIVDGQGIFDGQGSLWWPKINGKQQCNNPTGLRFNKCNNLRISNITTQNPPKNHFSIMSCNGVTISNIHIIAPGTSPDTDGIDVSSSTNVNIHDSTIATGDDCIGIINGCSNVNITNIACGPGGSISVGSLGKNESFQTVEDVRVRNCTFIGTQFGARIKTWPGGSGYARRILYDEITLVDTEAPILIDQNYCDGPCPQGLKRSALKISDVTFSRFQGSTRNKTGISLICSDVVGGCTNIVMDHVNITSSIPGISLSANCSNATGRSRFTVPEVSCLSEY